MIGGIDVLEKLLARVTVQDNYLKVVGKVTGTQLHRFIAFYFQIYNFKFFNLKWDLPLREDFE